MPDYSYSISTDFPGGVPVSTRRLDYLIRIDVGVTAFSRITAVGDVVTVYGVSSGEQAALDAVVAGYTAAPNRKLKIYRHIATNGTDHRQLDYKTGLIRRLYKKVTVIYRGELRCVEYFDDQAMTDRILKVDVVYVRGPTGLAQERTTTRSWYREDGSIHEDTKVTHKVYDNLHAMMEGHRRRKNVIDKLTLDVLMLLVATTAVDPQNPTLQELQDAEATGVAYISKYGSALDLYIRTGDLSFKVAPATPNITDDTETWLDTDLEPIGYPAGYTIRDVFLDSLKTIEEA